MPKPLAAAIAFLLLLAACGDRRDAAEPTVEPPAEATPAETAGPEARRPAGPTLRAITARGRLNCGVHEGLVGFAYTDNRGRWRGFDVDFCRALAAAALGEAEAARFTPLSIRDRFSALADGRVDVLWRNTSWTLTRDAEGFDFAGINYYDGQGFLVRRSLNLASATELNGARVCVQSGSTSELNLADFFRSRGINYEAVLVESEEAARAAYSREACDAFSADVSALAAARTTMGDPRGHVILPEVISKEALGPVVREDDPQWADIVRWTLNALILAEELGVTAANVDELARTSSNPQVLRLLGVDGDFGRRLGLSNDWARNAIRAGGNYGEIFERNIGSQSALDLARGLNASWNATPRGLHYALPIR